jgi:hypothetical protein
VLDTDTLAQATGCRPQDIAAVWPLLVDALVAEEIDHPLVQVGLAATVAVESRFRLVREVKPQARLGKWYGRGLIQLTHERNYAKYGDRIGVDLLTDPDVALHPKVAAKVAASYFRHSGSATASILREWRKVRLVNGPGMNGWAPFAEIITALGEMR